MTFSILLVSACFLLASADENNFPNIGYLGKGYDLFRACPRPFYSVVDPGYAAAVFDINQFTQNRMTADKRYNIPDFTQVVECRMCQLNLQVDIVRDEKEYAKTLGNHLDFSATVKTTQLPIPVDIPPIDLAFSRSKEMQSIKSQTSKKEKVFAESYATCAAYCANIETYGFGPDKLSQNFVIAVKYLNLDNVETFYGFLINFGSHYVANMHMGSLIWLRQSYSSSQFNSLSVNDDNAKNALGITIFGQGAPIDFGHQNNEYSSSNFTSISLSTQQFTMGAPPKKDPTEWIQDSQITPMPIYIRLQPIASLLEARLFPDDTKINEKRLMLEKVIADGSYCDYLMKLNGEPGTCKRSNQ